MQRKHTLGMYAGNSTQRVYEGKITVHGIQVVTVNGRPLPLALHVISRSPSGFSWGSAGTGSDQLAVAIMADAFGDSVAAQYSLLLHSLLQRVPKDRGWVMTEKDLHLAFLAQTTGDGTNATNAKRMIETFFKPKKK